MDIMFFSPVLKMQYLGLERGLGMACADAANPTLPCPFHSPTPVQLFPPLPPHQPVRDWPAPAGINSNLYIYSAADSTLWKPGYKYGCIYNFCFRSVWHAWLKMLASRIKRHDWLALYSNVSHNKTATACKDANPCFTFKLFFPF